MGLRQLAFAFDRLAESSRLGQTAGSVASPQALSAHERAPIRPPQPVAGQEGRGLTSGHSGTSPYSSTASLGPTGVVRAGAEANPLSGNRPGRAHLVNGVTPDSQATLTHQVRARDIPEFSP